MKQAIMNNTNTNINGFRFNSSVERSITVKEKFNIFTNTQKSDKNKLNRINTKIDTIKVCIRVRPLLDHEDVEFWKPDIPNNLLTTAK